MDDAGDKWQVFLTNGDHPLQAVTDRPFCLSQKNMLSTPKTDQFLKTKTREVGSGWLWVSRHDLSGAASPDCREAARGGFLDQWGGIWQSHGPGVTWSWGAVATVPPRGDGCDREAPRSLLPPLETCDSCCVSKETHLMKFGLTTEKEENPQKRSLPDFNPLSTPPDMIRQRWPRVGRCQFSLEECIVFHVPYTSSRTEPQV